MKRSLDSFSDGDKAELDVVAVGIVNSLGDDHHDDDGDVLDYDDMVDDGAKRNGGVDSHVDDVVDLTAKTT